MQRHDSGALEFLAELGEDIVLLEDADGVAEVTTKRDGADGQRANEDGGNRERDEGARYDGGALVRLDRAVPVVVVMCRGRVGIDVCGPVGRRRRMGGRTVPFGTVR